MFGSFEVLLGERLQRAKNYPTRMGPVNEGLRKEVRFHLEPAMIDVR
jgi:hypothetical protein